MTAEGGAALADVVRALDERLEVARYTEPDSNGLVVRGGERVRRVAASVNTSFHVIERAAYVQADLLLVHHRSWPEIDLEALVAEKHRRLTEAGISLYCAHSSLDGAEGIGNADRLAAATGLAVERRFAEYHGGRAGVIARARGGTLRDFVDRLRDVLDVEIQWWENAPRFERVAIITGAGYLTTMIEEAIGLGADTFVTGEGTMYTKLYARERGINLVFGTHYATERLGVQSLAAMLEERFGLPWNFIPEQDGIL